MNKKHNKTNNKRWIDFKKTDSHSVKPAKNFLDSPISAKFFKDPIRVSNRQKQEFFDFLKKYENQIVELENYENNDKTFLKNKKRKENLYKFYRTYKKIEKMIRFFHSQKKFANKYEGSLLGPDFEKQTKAFRLDPYLQKYQVNLMFRFKSLYTKKVKLDRSYRMWFRKPHIRTNQRPIDRWAFIVVNLFKHFYKLGYFMTELNYISSVAEANQKINYKRLTKNNCNVKSSASVFAGDLVLYNDNRIDLEDMLNSKQMRSHLNPFLEEDNYVQGAVVLKNAAELSREDSLLLNIPSTRFTDINFLRK